MKQKNEDINSGKGLNVFNEVEIRHVVYDLSIKDLNERIKKAKILDNAEQVAAYLSVKIDTVFRNRIPNKRITGINGKEYAVRIYKDQI